MYSHRSSCRGFRKSTAPPSARTSHPGTNNQQRRMPLVTLHRRCNMTLADTRHPPTTCSPQRSIFQAHTNTRRHKSSFCSSSHPRRCQKRRCRTAQPTRMTNQQGSSNPRSRTQPAAQKNRTTTLLHAQKGVRTKISITCANHHIAAFNDIIMRTCTNTPVCPYHTWAVPPAQVNPDGHGLPTEDADPVPQNDPVAQEQAPPHTALLYVLAPPVVP